MSSNQQQQSSAGESNAAAGAPATSSGEAKTRAIIESLSLPMDDLYKQVIQLVNERTTKTPAELAMQVTAINAKLATVRQRVRTTTGLNKSTMQLNAKVNDLKRQIRVQDEFFNSFKTRTRATDRAAAAVAAAATANEPISPDVVQSAESIRGACPTLANILFEDDSTQQTQTSTPRFDFDTLVPSCSAANSQRIHCKHCKCVVLNARVGRLVVDRPFDVPLPYKKNDRRPDEEFDTEQLTEWWSAPNMGSLVNVGFTHRHNGRQYLACADCELGPIGLVNVEDGKEQFLIARQRTET